MPKAPDPKKLAIAHKRNLLTKIERMTASIEALNAVAMSHHQNTIADEVRVACMNDRDRLQVLLSRFEAALLEAP